MFLRVLCGVSACKVFRTGQMVRQGARKFGFSFARGRLVAHNLNTRSQKMGPAGMASVLCLAVNCADKPLSPNPGLKVVEMKSLSHEYLIRQASTLTVDSATQLMTQTVNAFIETSRTYREAMSELIDAMSDCLEVGLLEGSEATVEAQELWEHEIEARLHVSELRKMILELDSFMEYAAKVGTAAAEVAFLAGSEYASTAMCERIASAQKAFEEEKEKNRKAENELLQAQQEQALGISSDPKKSLTVPKKGLSKPPSSALDSTFLLPSPSQEEASEPPLEQQTSEGTQESSNTKDNFEQTDSSTTTTTTATNSSDTTLKPEDLLDLSSFEESNKDAV